MPSEPPPPTPRTPSTPLSPTTIAERRRLSVRWGDELPTLSLPPTPRVASSSMAGPPEPSSVNDGDKSAPPAAEAHHDSDSDDTKEPEDAEPQPSLEFRRALAKNQYTPHPSAGNRNPFESAHGDALDESETECDATETQTSQSAPSVAPSVPDQATATAAQRPMSYAQHRAERAGPPPPAAIQPPLPPPSDPSASPAQQAAPVVAAPANGQPAQPQLFYGGTNPFASPYAAYHAMLPSPYYPQSGPIRQPNGHAAPIIVPQEAYLGFPHTPLPPWRATDSPGFAPPAWTYTDPDAAHGGPRMAPAPGYRSAPVVVAQHATQPYAMYDQSEGLEALNEERDDGAGLNPQAAPGDRDMEVGGAAGLDIGATGGGDPSHRTSLPAKPSLRRMDTVESVYVAPARNAEHLVNSHLSDSKVDSTSQAGQDTRVTGGVLSHLLKLYGDEPHGMSRRDSDLSCTTLNDGVSVGMESRTSSVNSVYHGRDGLRKRRPSDASSDGDDYRRHLGNHGRGSGKREKHSDDDSDGHHSDCSVKSNKSFASVRLAINHVSDRLKSRRAKRKQHRASITKHVTDILQRQHFILKLAKALMFTGAPSHRLESQLSATARVLEIDAQFVHLPNIVIATFGDYETRTSETHFVKASGDLDVGRLFRVHQIYRSVVHDMSSVIEGSEALHKLLNEPPIYNLWQRMLIAALSCWVISMLGFDGSFVDSFVAGAFGGFLTFMQLRATKNQLYSNIFEISIATLVSFISRALSTTGIFCYESLASAGVALILPGYAILCGSLELASKNLIAGSVRMVYAIIYSLFLGFGISIGSDFYFVFDPAARAALEAEYAPAYSVTGSFSGYNGTLPILAGTFTFTNATDDQPTTTLSAGNVMCRRDPNWEWWRQRLNPLWMILLVPAFSFLLSLHNLQPIKSRQLPVMVIISCAGFVCNFFANLYIFDRSDVVSFLGSFAVGVLGNAYSRVFKSTAFTTMTTGVLFLVPSGISAAGGLAMTYRSAAGDSYTTGLVIGFRMISIAIGITVGLFFSSFVVYSFGRSKSTAAFTF